MLPGSSKAGIRDPCRREVTDHSAKRTKDEQGYECKQSEWPTRKTDEGANQEKQNRTQQHPMDRGVTSTAEAIHHIRPAGRRQLRPRVRQPHFVQERCIAWVAA